MTKIILLSSISAFVLSANTFINPLPISSRAIDNGGVKQAIDAYKDGIGAELMDKPGVATDNSAMNTLVLKYGEAAKANNVTIVDQVVYGNGTSEDKIIAGKLTIDGAACNDGNAAITGETWLNGSCQGGININGTSCNDGNIETINDTYTNGICSGYLLTTNYNLFSSESTTMTNSSNSSTPQIPKTFLNGILGVAIDSNNVNPYAYGSINSFEIINFNKMCLVKSLTTIASATNPTGWPTRPFKIYKNNNNNWELIYTNSNNLSSEYKHTFDFTTDKIKIEISTAYTIFFKPNFKNLELYCK